MINPNILVIRQHNQIGDLLCSLSLYKAIKKKYPDSHITLVAAKTNYQIPFFEINPYINEVLIFDKSSIRTIINFYIQLRKRKYEYGFVPSTIAVSRTSHIINFFSGAKYRVGANSIDGKKNKSARLLNIKKDFHWKDKHQLIRNLEIAQLAGLDLSEDELLNIKFSFNDKEISFANNFIRENFPDNSKKIIAFHPGAGKLKNQWPVNSFFELINQFWKEFNINVMITYGNIDKMIVENLIEKMKESEIPFVLLNNELPLKSQSAILSMIDLYITNDTGSMHIGGFGRVKMISLFSETNPLEWCPVYENSHFIKSPTNKIEDISVNQVYELAKKVISN